MLEKRLFEQKSFLLYVPEFKNNRKWVGASVGLTALEEMQVQSLGGKDLLEKKMANRFSILSWKIPWTEEPGGL